MAVASHSAGSHHSPSPLSRLMGELAARWRHARAYRAEYNKTLHELSHFTDRELADLGLSRIAIHEVARQQADMKVGAYR